MHVGDVVAIRWLDSGTLLHDATEEEAVACELEEVTCYGRVVHSCPKRIVVAHETGRGDAGTYGVILRGCVLSVQVLVPAKEQGALPRVSGGLPRGERRATASGWGLASSNV